MEIHRHLSKGAFGEAEIERLSEAYESCLKKLGLMDRNDPVTELIAAKIIQIYRGGEHDTAAICARALKELGIPGVN